LSAGQQGRIPLYVWLPADPGTVAGSRFLPDSPFSIDVEAAGTTLPTLGELPFAFLAAALASPSRSDFGIQRLFHDTFGLGKVIIVNADLRPALNRRDFAGTSGKKLVFEPASDPLPLQNILEYTHQRDICSTVHCLHVHSALTWTLFSVTIGEVASPLRFLPHFSGASYS
jgi:hypothetical protein